MNEAKEDVSADPVEAARQVLAWTRDLRNEGQLDEITPPQLMIPLDGDWHIVRIPVGIQMVAQVDFNWAKALLDRYYRAVVQSARPSATILLVEFWMRSVPADEGVPSESIADDPRSLEVLTLVLEQPSHDARVFHSFRRNGVFEPGVEAEATGTAGRFMDLLVLPAPVPFPIPGPVN